MRGWLAHMSVKGNLLFITQTAGVEVMIFTPCILYVCLLGGGVSRSLEFGCVYNCRVNYLQSVCPKCFKSLILPENRFDESSSL